MKLSSAVRNWRGNLDESVRRSWKRFVKAFREEYCKVNTPNSEYYYTTFQRKSETPREFYYILNKIAGKADIDVTIQPEIQVASAAALTEEPELGIWNGVPDHRTS
ncbi:hypothetical protein PHMEG_00025595 [Phytophthora megakarya]|uniref:Retrotransposon gag domain-containing protein n=1 Tax=Phytophthora megakarya TaxID=4795 RepID=A0A225VBS5_9STRA|nr:hypothetical protein PHMEG_00025595 [Phytophthora megakarya]